MGLKNACIYPETAVCIYFRLALRRVHPSERVNNATGTGPGDEASSSKAKADVEKATGYIAAKQKRDPSFRYRIALIAESANRNVHARENVADDVKRETFTVRIRNETPHNFETQLHAI